MKSPDEQRRIVAYLDGLYPCRHLQQANVNALREWWSSRASAVLARIETQSASGEELSVLMPSVLDRAFKGEW